MVGAEENLFHSELFTLLGLRVSTLINIKNWHMELTLGVFHSPFSAVFLHDSYPPGFPLHFAHHGWMTFFLLSTLISFCVSVCVFSIDRGFKFADSFLSWVGSNDTPIEDIL
jgi:hypothetical protein